MKIKALNEPDTSISTSDESSNSEDGQQTLSKEAFNDQCFEKYKQALLAIRDQQEDKARALLEELEEDLNDMDEDSDTLAQLRFSVLRNLGNLETDDIQHFIKALEIDSTDVSLWIKAGDRSMKLSAYPFARLCYEQALALNPNHWVAIDRLVELYYILHLPFELYDICSKALSLNSSHRKAKIMLDEAKRNLPHIDKSDQPRSASVQDRNLVTSLSEIKRKRQTRIYDELQKFKRARLAITLDTARTQSLASFGNYIIKVYERFAKQCITRNTMISITINNTPSFSQQISNGSINSQSNNQNSSEPQTTCSQDIDMVVEVEGASNSDKSDNRNEPTTSNDDNDQSKINSRSRSAIQSSQKNSSLSFAAMLFPMDFNDKRRSSRNRSNQDDTFSFKMKFDELNELLPECLRIGAIEQTFQKRREGQQFNADANKEDTQEESVLVETNLEPVREDLIIKDVVEVIAGKIQPSGTTISNIKLCHMFYAYLSTLSTKKQVTLPDAYAKIYKIYRKLCPLPNGIFLEVGPNGIDLDEIWFTLTANEITYQHQECMFILRILEQLQVFLDEAQFKDFLVRLFLILGLNTDHKYLDLALQNIDEDARVYASNRKIITRAHIKTLIDRKNEKLQQETVEESDNSVDIINRLAPKSENEMSDREIILLCNAVKSTKLWQRGLDILNQRNDLNSDIIIDTINICLKNGAKMDAILSSKLCKEAVTGSRPTTWTCLFRGWRSVLTEEELESETTIDNMHKFFDLGHQTLGKKGCCTSDKGEFLMLHVEHWMNNDEEERDLLASLHCLFGYPNKKPALVANHKGARVPITWEYAEIIYEYFALDDKPTYMSLLRKVGLTSEKEMILKEMASVTPPELDPRRHVHVIENFIEKGEPMSRLNLSNDGVTSTIFYFLADYYFKNKEFAKAREYYHYDLVFNPDNFDSWAASGLIRASEIDKALSEGLLTTENFVEGPFHDLADSAIRCFEEATKLKPHEPNATLWIEFGNLTYNLTSMTSRLYIYDDFEYEIEGKEPKYTNKLVERHKHLYQLAKKCFISASTLCVCDEKWLHFYMLGKIHEKNDTLKALEYYYMADAQLFIENATYPKRISYHNPPELAYEAMEIHYRTHAAALKFLLTSDELSPHHMHTMKRYLLNAQRSSFVRLEGLSNTLQAMESRVEEDVALFLHDTVDFVANGTHFDELIFMCLHGMKQCLVRCDKNFKALYRLAFYYRKIRDPRMAQEIMVSREIRTDRRIQNLLKRRPGHPEFMSAPPDLQGVDSLFKDRKIGNLFFNIWRMPIEEIDRPGCFEHWMFKCTWLLIKTCLDLNDTSLLTVIAFQLSRQPETSKKYLQDKPRVLLALFALKSIISIINGAIDKAETMEIKQKYIRDGMMIADKFVKANIFPNRMRDVYTQLQGRCMTALANSFGPVQ